MTKKKDNILPEVEIVAKYPHEQRVINTMNASNAEFMQRLRNNDLRMMYTPTGHPSTHIMASEDNYAFPLIQDRYGHLEDIRHYVPQKYWLDNSIENNDAIKFQTEGDTRYFVEHYKKYFPQFFSHFGDNQYAEGGDMEAPKHWDELSMADKSDVMAAAVRNGITTLEEIRKAWNDYVDSHEYAKGGYMPSASIKRNIANWEGSSMKTNRSFEAEAADFNRVIPASIRAKLNQQQLDALYSYGYNVGMGNLKKRVLPMLEQYTQGRAGAGDVAASMWASKDPLLKGLQRRRAWERGMFTGNAPTSMQGSSVNNAIHMDLSNLPSMYSNSEISNPIIQQPYYTVPKITLQEESIPMEQPQITLEEPKEEKPDILGNISRIQNVFNLFGDTDTAQQLNPLTDSFLEAWKGLGNSYAEGGKKEGITSSNGNYHVNPVDYWAVLGNAESGKPLEVTTPEVTVTAANSKNYRSSYDPNGFMEFMNTVTLGIDNRFSLTQNAKLLMDAYNASIGKKSWSDVGNSAILGNNGVFENPYANMLIDTALPMAFGQAQRLNELSKLKKIGYTGVPHKEILVGKDKKPLLDFNGSPVYMDEHFPLTHKEHTIWTSNDADYGRTFIDNNGTVYDVYADPKKLKVLETPKPSDTEYIKWTQLPYKYQNNSVVWDTPLFKFNDGSVALNKKAALEKRLPAGDYDRAYSSTLVQKMINPRSGLSTDNIVRFSNKNGYNATKFYRVHDGPIELGNMPYDYPINETVLNPTTESYVLPYGSSKLGLLKQLELNNYITLPLLWSQQNYTNK